MKTNRLILLSLGLLFISISQGQNLVYEGFFGGTATEDKSFGRAIALDNNIVAVGAPNAEVNGTLLAGQVTLFERNVTTNEWVEIQTILPIQPSFRLGFGKSIALSNDLLFIGAPATNTSLAGRVDVYERNNTTGQWSRIHVLTGGDVNDADEFGAALSIFGDRLLVGAPTKDIVTSGAPTLEDRGVVFLFEKSGTGAWEEEEQIVSTFSNANTSNDFGVSVAQTSDYIFIGSFEDATISGGGGLVAQNLGRLFVLKRNGSTWSHSQNFMAQGLAPANGEQRFSGKIALGNNHALVTSSQPNDETYFYHLMSNGDWELVQTEIDTSGILNSSLALQGDLAIIGNTNYSTEDMPQAGSLVTYKYDAAGNHWTIKEHALANPSEVRGTLGGSIAIDGTTVLAGAPNGISSIPRTGSVHEFKIETCSLADQPIIEASVSEICQGEEVTLSIQSGELNDSDDWQWYSSTCGGTPVGNGVSVTISPSVKTTYFVRGESSCGNGSCGSRSIKVSPSPQPVIVQESAVLAPTQTYESYQWVVCFREGFEPLNKENSKLFSPRSSASYNVIVTDVNGCEGTAKECFPVVVTSIGNDFEDDFSIYPNPTSGLIYLNQTIGWRLNSITGGVMNSGFSSEIDLSNYESGIYFLSLESGRTIKIIKK